MKNMLRTSQPRDFRTIKTLVAGVILIFAVTVYGCKDKAFETAEPASDTKAETEMQKTASSSAAVEKPANDRKFIRTADLKFKVKNAAKSTYAIENAVAQAGGFVTYTNLQSNVTEKHQTKISRDSTLQTTKYSVENNITIRVPNTRLDTVVKTIAKEIDFLDYRLIKADDVSLQLLANSLAQNRSIQKENRLASAIDHKGKKLVEITDAENQLDGQKQENDSHKIENLALRDKISFSTLTLQIYQDETLRSEIVATEPGAGDFRPNIGLQLLDAVKTGWYILESVIAFLVQLWSLALMAILAFLAYRKFRKVPG